MSVEFFVDTNVFIYQLEASNARKKRIADDIVIAALSRGCISFQVVQECLNTVLRKATVPLSTREAEHYLNDVLKPLWRVMPSPQLYSTALQLQDRYQYSFYDSLIIAAALEAGCKRLLTEDLQHGQTINELMIENPFLQ